MFRIVVTVIVLLVLALPVLGWWLAQSSLPKSDGVSHVPILLKEASVVMDGRGVPNIQASSEADLYRAQGYWTASARLFQMDMYRRMARGELSAVYGNQCLPTDKLMRQIGLGRMAAEEFKVLSQEAKNSLKDYAAGVNEYIREAERHKSPEFLLLGYYPRTWTPEDTLAVLKYIQYLSEESWTLDDLKQRVLEKVGPVLASQLFEHGFPQEVEKAPPKKELPDSVSIDSNVAPGLSKLHAALPGSLPGSVRRVVETVPGFGSNGWLVSGTVSDSQGALLALDRHSSFTDPNLWYVCTLSAGGYRVGGITIPGVPGIMYGRNGDIGWGATAYKADTQDLFVEQFSTQFPNKYKTVEGWGTAKTFNEEIECKAAFQRQIFQHKVTLTAHGPVLLTTEDRAVVLSWTGFDKAVPQYESFFKINRAKDWNAFREILKAYKGSPQTFLYADNKGNIGYQIAGNVPTRAESAYASRLDGSQIFAGWTGAGQWTGRVDFAEMPFGYNPADGYAVAGFSGLPGFNLQSTPYPVQRINAVLASLRKSTRRPGLSEMADLQADEYAPLSQLVKSVLTKSTKQQSSIERSQQGALEMMQRWNGYLDRKSAFATIYEAFLQRLARRLLTEKLGESLTQEYLKRWPRWTVQVERFLRHGEKDAALKAWLPSEERTFDTFIQTTFATAIADLKGKNEKANVSDWAWSKFHTIKFHHLFFEGLPALENSIGILVNGRPAGIGGDSDTVNACNVEPVNPRKDAAAFPSTYGPTSRLLIDMSDADKFYETQPRGQSGHLISPTRFDTLISWIQGNPLPVSFSEAEIERSQRHKVILTPESLQ